MARRPLVVAALQPKRQFHSSIAADGASAALGGVELAAPPASVDAVSMMEPPGLVEGTTRQEGVAGAQTPGKNRRKKLRKQQEAEAARAASGEAAETKVSKAAVAVTGEGPIGPIEGNSAAHKEAEAEPAEKKRVKKPRWTDARRAEQRLASSGRLQSSELESESSEPQSPRPPRPARSSRPPSRPPSTPPRLPSWKIQKRALKDKFPDGWQPRKRLSPDALEGIRALHRQFPDVYTTPALAKHFMVSAEVVRRILKSKWQPQPAEEEDRQERWFKRGKQVWARWAALGRKPPKRWQAEGIRRDSSWAGRRQRQMEGVERGEREERGERGEDVERGEAVERDLGQGARGQGTDEREGAAARSRRSAGQETQSLGRKMRLQREPQNDESESSAWLFAKGPGDK